MDDKVFITSCNPVLKRRWGVEEVHRKKSYKKFSAGRSIVIFWTLELQVDGIIIRLPLKIAG
jgi:hypothetical protein